MAVSLGAGFGMRSDFMISDAALPMRVDEAADFAGFLAQTDVAAAANAGEMTLPNDLQKLAEMVVNGEVKLEDIPEELVTAEFVKLVSELNQTVATNEEEIPAQEKDEDTSAAAAFVQLDIPDDLSAEFNEIAKAVSENTQPTAKTAPTAPVSETLQRTVQPTEVKPLQAGNLVQEEVFEQQEMQPEIAEQPEFIAQMQQPVEGAADFTQQLQSAAQQPQEVIPMQPEQITRPVQQTETSDMQGKTDAVQSETQTIPVTMPQSESGADNAPSADANSGDNGTEEFFSEMQSAPAAKAQPQPREQELFKDAEFTVEQKQPEPEAQTAQTDMQLKTQAGQGRVKAASEELELLRNAVKKPEPEQSAPKTEFAQRTQAPLTAQSPVTFTAQNGKEIEVKPAELAQQVTQKLVETAQQTAERETEYSMTLNPEELGKITVKLTKAADGAVSVTIAAENSRTRELLEQNSALIQENLRANGMQLEQWQTVSESQQETYAQDYNGSSKNPYQREDNAQQDGGEAEDNTFAELIASM